MRTRREYPTLRLWPSDFGSPESYIPKHLAERIRTSKSSVEGERKHVTVLFVDLKGSMELIADQDPEVARTLLDPVVERMMEAVHRYEIAHETPLRGICASAAGIPRCASAVLLPAKPGAP